MASALYDRIVSDTDTKTDVLQATSHPLKLAAELRKNGSANFHTPTLIGRLVTARRTARSRARPANKPRLPITAARRRR